MKDDDEAGVFAVVVEFQTEGPILMETSGCVSSREAAFKRRDELLSRCVRATVVRVVPEKWGGNELLLHDMKRMQE
jgi:hypothetical protein